jgi:hypothetical protein
MPDDEDRVRERANEELLPILRWLAHRRRQRLCDIHNAEIDALRIVAVESALNQIAAARAMAKEHGRNERDTVALDVIAAKFATEAGIRVAGDVLGEDARQYRDPHQRVTTPGPPPAPRGSFSTRPPPPVPKPPAPPWEHSQEVKTPTYQQAADREAAARETKLKRRR